MAIPFLSNINMNKNEIQNLVLHSQTSDPTGTEGQIYYNSNTNKVLIHNGSSFINISGDIADVALTAGNGIDITQATDSDGNYTATISTDLKANGGLVIESTEIAVDLGASSITGTLAVADGGTGVTSKTGTGSVVLSNSPTLVTPALGTPSALVGTNITGTAASLTAGKVTVTETTGSGAGDYNVVYHDGSNGLLDEEASTFFYTPSTETLTVKNLNVTVKTTQKEVELINTSGGVVFEGDTNDDHETTLDVINPTADRTINLPNKSGTVAMTSDLVANEKVTKLLSGDGSNTTYTIDHGFGTNLVMTQVLHYGNAGSGATYDVVQVEVQAGSDTDKIDVIFGTAPTTSEDYLVLVSKFPAAS